MKQRCLPQTVRPVPAAVEKPVSTQRCGRGTRSLEGDHSREGCMLQMKEGVGWGTRLLKRGPSKKCIMAAVLPKHLDTGAPRREALIPQSPHA